MKHFIKAMLSAVVLIVSASLAFAEVSIPAKKSVDPAKTSVKTAKKPPAESKLKKAKFVDVNSASKPELMKLRGVSGLYADRIIAARPYGSKAHMITKGVVPDGVYQGIKALVVAKQPFADSAKNAEALGKAQKK